MQCMELKLGTHVYLSASMATIDKKLPQALFNVTTSSLLKLANHAMHGGETWYACVFQRFHDDHEQKWPQALFSCNYFFTSQTSNPCNACRWNLVCMCISAFPWRPWTINGLRHFFPVTTSSLLKLANHAMHGGKTWYACVFQRFHDNHEQKMASGTFFL